MPKAISTFKQRAHELIDQLPETADWNDLAHEASLLHEIEAGLADSEANRVTPNDEVRRRFKLPDLSE